MNHQITVADVLAKISYVDFTGDRNARVTRPIALDPQNTDTETISWCNDKNAAVLETIHAGTVICSKNVDRTKLSDRCNFIITENPRRAFQQVLVAFFAKDKPEPGIASTAIVHPSARIGENVSIGHYTVIEAHCEIGDHTVIGTHNSIQQGTIIGKYVRIGSNNSIGGTGFGYEKNEEGQYELVPHIGNVILRDRVEISSNSTIARAVLASTILEENVKMDNKVHVAHNVKIGRNTMVTANVMIAGSTTIGADVWIGPSTAVLNKLTIHDKAFIGIGAVVIRDVEPGQTVVGNPAKPLNKDRG